MFKFMIINVILFLIIDLQHHCLILISDRKVFWKPYLHDRTIRQTSSCRKNEVRCNSGQCISKYVICDGTQDCNDGTDETKEKCFGLNCNENSFRCDYGACVSSSVKCNGINDCADKSDEIGCSERETNVERSPKTSRCGKNFSCHNGACIDSTKTCDGRADCCDGSDETVELCQNFPCMNAFQCSYGACVVNAAKCNGVYDCYDGSDENLPECLGCSSTEKCILPERPQNGCYRVNNDSYIKPGIAVPLNTVLVNYCEPGYKLEGDQTIFCTNSNKWLIHTKPKCLKTCTPNFDFSIDVECTLNNVKVNCFESPIENTIVSARCKEYYFFRKSDQRDLENYGTSRCVNGEWIPSLSLMTCAAECGQKRMKSDMVPVIFGGRNVTDNRKYPWHVGLYRRWSENLWSNVCGGSIIRSNIVLTAAHCFMHSENPNKYAIGAGKIFKKWQAENDSDAQYVHVKSIHISEFYKGEARNWAHDIAILILQNHLEFNQFILPICIDWTRKIVLNESTIGSVAGWGLTVDGEQSPILKDIDLPFIPFQQCITNLKENIKVHTEDKICAGRKDGQVICEGDSGGAYAVLNHDGLYYVIGVASISKQSTTNDKKRCDTEVFTLFTNVSFHTEFLKNVTKYQR